MERALTSHHSQFTGKLCKEENIHHNYHLQTNISLIYKDFIYYVIVCTYGEVDEVHGDCKIDALLRLLDHNGENVCPHNTREEHAEAVRASIQRGEVRIVRREEVVYRDGRVQHDVGEGEECAQSQVVEALHGHDLVHYQHRVPLNHGRLCLFIYK